MFAVFDIETSIYESYGRKGNPFDKRNYVVSVGLLYQDGTRIKTHKKLNKELLPKGCLKDVKCLVGINIKFDLLYYWRDPELVEFFKRGGRIYDCQYARYLVTAQQDKWASMNSMAAAYGLNQKPDKIKEYWEAGVQTIDIPVAELLEYLDHDLDTTRGIFLNLVQDAKNRGMAETIRQHMEGLCATVEMEYNGLKIDMEVARKNQKDVEEELDELNKKLQEFIPDDLPEDLEFNWGSGDHLSALLYGGEVKYKKRTQIFGELGEPLFAMKTIKKPCKDLHGNEIIIKSGPKKGQVRTKNVKVPDPDKPKMRYEEFTYEFPRQVVPKPAWALKKPGFYKTDEEVLKEVVHDNDIPFVKVLLRWKKLDKDLGTYYQRGDKGMLCFVQDGNIIHHSLNNVQTETGRLSSSKPNCQNISRGNTSNVKEMFVSRFGEDGVMGEADYSNLEVFVQAVLSGDVNLIRDLNSGVDMHCKRLATKVGRPYEEILKLCKVDEDPYWDLQRTLAKQFSFQRAFGAGPKKIAISTGMDVDDVKALIKGEEKTYPSIVKYNNYVERTVKMNKSKTFYKTSTGATRHFGWHSTFTGKRYGFTEYEALQFQKDQGIETSFKPTEMKNYSVQGTAGEMVLTIAGIVWRKFLETDNYGGKAFLINTVHDCFWLDMHKDVRDEVLTDLRKIMVSIPEVFERLYKKKIPLKFKVDVEVGKNMKDLHKWQPEKVAA